jgi:hypothetical protein
MERVTSPENVEVRDAKGTRNNIHELHSIELTCTLPAQLEESTNSNDLQQFIFSTTNMDPA